MSARFDFFEFGFAVFKLLPCSSLAFRKAFFDERRILMNSSNIISGIKAYGVDGMFISSFKDEFSSLPKNKEYTVFPGFCDVHVHFREPGFLYKETIKSGSFAAAHGGYTDVCTMPNLDPVPDSFKNLSVQLQAINRDSVINVHPYGSITVEQKGKELSDLNGLSPYVVAFSDDGKGVQNEEIMMSAMEKAKSLDKIIVAHCEDESLLFGGYINKGEYAAKFGHKGICSESEWKPIERDLRLAKLTGCKYHVCHISCKESVDLIRKAKAEGVDVTCETAPHYLTLDENCLRDDGRFKMNPPLRTAADREALIEGMLDGTVDMIATDHAPHSAEEKSKGLIGSSFGIVGLETAFSVLYTKLVKTGTVPLERIIEALTVSPRRRFGLAPNGFSVWCLDEEYTVNPEEFLSKGRSTPFAGEKLFGKCYMTVCGNNTVYKYKL